MDMIFKSNLFVNILISTETKYEMHRIYINICKSYVNSCTIDERLTLRMFDYSLQTCDNAHSKPSKQLRFIDILIKHMLSLVF